MADGMKPGASALSARLSAELQNIRDADLYRVRRVIDGGHGVRLRVNGRDCVNFCSNDYLGLATDPRLADAARRALAQGTGSTASALICGYNREHQQLEEELAEFVGRPRALLFSTGWAANLGVLRGLLGRRDRIVADELNHASLIDGGRLSGAEYLRIAHADLDACERALATPPAHADALTVLVADGVFSMDGDLAPLPQLSALAQRHGAALMIDDAHGLGVLGSGGRGIVEHYSEQASVPPALPDIQVATLGKSLGAAGAFVAGDAELIDYLVQRARSWVFSTAPPPAIAAAAHRALQIIRSEPQHRLQLHANIARFREGARALGIPLGESITPIQPLVIGEAARTLALSAFLFERGWWVAAIRPPTVPKNTSRLRITLTAAHSPAQIDGLLDALAAGLRQLG